jgi:hypothetical protein
VVQLLFCHVFFPVSCMRYQFLFICIILLLCQIICEQLYESDKDDHFAGEHLGDITEIYKEHLQSLYGDDIFPPSNSDDTDATAVEVPPNEPPNHAEEVKGNDEDASNPEQDDQAEEGRGMMKMLATIKKMILLRKCREMMMLPVTLNKKIKLRKCRVLQKTLKKMIKLRKCRVMMKIQMITTKNLLLYWLTWPLLKMT